MRRNQKQLGRGVAGSPPLYAPQRLWLIPRSRLKCLGKANGAPETTPAFISFLISGYFLLAVWVTATINSVVAFKNIGLA